MPYSHTIPRDRDINYIVSRPEIPHASYGYSVDADGNYVLAYEGTEEDYKKVVAMLAAYPADYGNFQKVPRWERVKEIRAMREDLPAPTNEGPVDTDDSSKIKVLGIVMMAQLAISAEQQAASAEKRDFDPSKVAFNEEFTLADNTYVTLTAFTAIDMAKAAGLYVSQVHAHARALRQLINDAKDIDELMAIDIVDGWPAAGIEPSVYPGTGNIVQNS